jgi:hypothetical protein
VNACTVLPVVDINALRALAPLPRAPVPRPSRPQPRTPQPRWSRRHSYVKAVLALEAVRRKREARYERVVRPLDRKRDALTVEVATRLRALSGGQRAAAQRLLALFAPATASSWPRESGDAILLDGYHAAQSNSRAGRLRQDLR